MDLLLMVILLAFAIEQTAHLVTTSKIASPMRELLLAKNKLLGELVSCHECTSFWISCSLIWLVRPLESLVLNIVLAVGLLLPVAICNYCRTLLLLSIDQVVQSLRLGELDANWGPEDLRILSARVGEIGGRGEELRDLPEVPTAAGGSLPAETADQGPGHSGTAAS